MRCHPPASVMGVFMELKKFPINTGLKCLYLKLHPINLDVDIVDFVVRVQPL